jgi:hypothetical protein
MINQPSFIKKEHNLDYRNYVAYLPIEPLTQEKMQKKRLWPDDCPHTITSQPDDSPYHAQ